jgi:hypothetical protein
VKEKYMSEEKILPPNMHQTPEITSNNIPLLHRDDSLEHEYLIEVSPDLPRVKLRVFIFPNGDAKVEAEFEQLS